MRNVLFGFVLLIASLLFIQREIILSGKVIFPANFLAQFYSPWSTEKFSGWEAGIPHKPIGTDQIRFFYPSRTFTNALWQKGEVPLWNPYIFSGNPHIADYQSAVFYPLNVLYFFLPQILAWSLLIFIEPLLAAIFTYLFLRLFKIERVAAFLGAGMFGLSGFMTVWGQENMVVPHAALWLPLLLYGIEGYLQSNKFRYGLVGTLALGFSFLAGFFQLSFYICVFALVYAFFRIRQLENSDKLTKTLAVVGIFILGGSLAAIQIVPSVEGFFESPRNLSSVSYHFDTYLLPITHILNLFAPDMFGSPGSYNFFGRGFYHETVGSIGIVPLIFSLFAIVKFRANRIISFFSLAVFLSLLLTLNTPLTRFFFSLQIPLVSTFVPSRILLLVTFSLAVLSAFGFSLWLQNGVKKEMVKIIFTVYIILGATLLYAGVSYAIFPAQFESFNTYFIRDGGFTYKSYIVTMIKNLSLPLFFLIILVALTHIPLNIVKRMLPQNSRITGKQLMAIGIVILAFISQLYFFNKYLSIGFEKFLYPEHPVFSFMQDKSNERFIAFGKPILGNIASEKNTYSPEGLDPIFSYRYGQLMHAVKNNGKITTQLPRIEVTLSELGDKEKITDNPLRMRILSLLGVRYILYFDDVPDKKNPTDIFPEEKFQEVHRAGQWIMYEYEDTLPRAFLGKNSIIETDLQSQIDKLADPQFDPTQTILLEEPMLFGATGDIPTNSEKVEIQKYMENRVELSAIVASNSALFLSDTYYPGWKAFVDDVPTKIYRANVAFRAIALSPGEHKVVFSYDPLSFKIGAILSIFSATILFFITMTIVIRAIQRTGK